MTTDGSSRRSVFWTLAPLYLALHLSLVWLVTILAVNRGNTLHANGHWTSAKVGLERGVMGAVGTMVTRVPLHRNRLDLGAYFGYQQLTRSEERDLSALGFDFQIERWGYLDVLFGPDPESLSGIRLSARPDMASLFFRVAPSGEFLERSELGGVNVEGWQEGRLAFSGAGAEVSVDGSHLAALPGDFSRVRTIGFRGCALSGLVDDVELSFRDGSAPVLESFESARPALPVFLGAFFGLGFAAVGGFRLLALGGRATRRLHFGLITFYVVAVTGLAAFVVVDFTRISAHYPRNPYQVPDGSYEDRSQDFDGFLQALRDRRDPPRASGVFRILLVGTSQTWGAGARHAEETIERVLEARLDGAANRRVEVIGAGLSAFTAPRLLEIHERDWIHLLPDLVVLNLSFNDQDPAAFRAALEQFVSLDRAQGAETLFVLEPATTEMRRPANHAIMREVAGEQGVAFLDMHSYLAERRGEGFLWWDVVHLTPFGQRLFAERLAQEIRALYLSPAGGPP